MPPDVRIFGAPPLRMAAAIARFLDRRSASGGKSENICSV